MSKRCFQVLQTLVQEPSLLLNPNMRIMGGFRSLRDMSTCSINGDLVIWDSINYLVSFHQNLQFKQKQGSSARCVKLSQLLDKFVVPPRCLSNQLHGFSSRKVVSSGEIPENLYKLNVGLCGSSKRAIQQDVEGRFSDGSVYEVGEDAMFVTTDTLAVADGVGGWNQDPNGNPGLYSKTLLRNIYDFLSELECSNGTAYQGALPEEVLMEAYKKTTGILGSCTVCVALLRNSELRVANVGDCGMLVYRNGSCIMRSSEQQHSFNYPFQLGYGSLTTPLDAQLMKANLAPNDIVVMGSDGLFDNLFDHQIIEIIRMSHEADQSQPGIIAANLVNAAKKAATNRRISTPFSVRASSEGLYYPGGKIDDISVVVGIMDLAKRLQEV